MTQAPTLLSQRRRAAGVSLIEALVALAVVAFGMLGVVGMQSTMRTGADISRQRSEAVRIAQEELERLRNYSVIRASDAAAGQLAFAQIVAAAAASVAASNANTIFFLETLVPAAAASDPMLPVRQVRTIVTWADRSASAANQRVELTTAIAGLPAELSALHATRTDRTLLAQPYGRNAAIPRAAVDQGNGTSIFTPPGLPGVTWSFNNASGLITQVCTPVCGVTSRQLLSGYVAFATGATPSSGEAEDPTDSVVSLTMKVQVTEPALTPDQDCATESVGLNRLAYYCALPTVNVTAGRVWSGQVVFGTLSLSGTTADTTTTNYKVCRYTPDDRNLQRTPPELYPDLPAGETESYFNSRHPYFYRRANVPLQNKNFLVISAGNGSAAYGCPADDEDTPIESNTWPHQPIS